MLKPVPSAELIRTSFRAMGCDNEIVVAAVSVEAAREAMEFAAREVLRIEAKYSRYRSDDGSIVHRINSRAGSAEPIACDPETIELLHVSDHLYKLSGGLFDVTSGILRRAWDFRRERPPEPSEIHRLLPLIGWDKVEFREDAFRLPLAGMEVDFGGIGKEYAADRAAAALTVRKVRHFYVNLGGDIRAAGGMPDGRPWRFGVADPRQPGGVIAHIDLADGSLATSGDYERFMLHNGTRFCHILNPRTGNPVNCWRSVSIKGVSSLAAGATATIAMLKEEGAIPFLDKVKASYLLVDREGRLISNRVAE